MKEIKFKAWDKMIKKMNRPMTLFEIVKEFKNWDQRRFTVDDFLWLQYIGIKDGEGQEIYEGDVVEPINKNPHLGIFAIEWIDDEDWDERVGWALGRAHSESYRVIGNIYENPELLTNPKA